MLPLQGIRVLAVTQYAAGPFGTMHLADLGAEVINIEDPGSGDFARQVPPFAADGDSLFYQSFNRSKKSLTLNLRADEGRAIFRRLAAQSQVVFNNLRGDMPAKLGLNYAALQAVNPKLVCVSCSGFGPDGPRATEPVYDYLVQAYLGIMDLTGEPDGPPSRAGISFIDFSTGVMGALGCMVGLWQAEQTGRGLDVNTSLFETALSYLNYVASWWLNGQFMLRRTPDSSHPTVAPSQRFRTRDGYVMVMAQTEKFWQLLCQQLGRDDLLADPRFATVETRYEHADAVRSTFAAIFAAKTTAEWVELLRGKVPVAPVNTLAEGLADPQVAARRMLVEYEHPRWGRLQGIRTALDLSGVEQVPPRAAPALGADTEAVLGELLGLTPAAVTGLRSRGIV